MKAGTAQKVVLNLFSTLVMVRLGRIHRGLMVDMNARNAKLRQRAVRMLRELTGARRRSVRAALDGSGRARENRGAGAARARPRRRRGAAGAARRPPARRAGGPRRMKALRRGRLFDGTARARDRAVLFDGARIVGLRRGRRGAGGAECIELPNDHVLAPGFVDLQVNGGGGVLFNDAPDAATLRAHRRARTRQPAPPPSCRR